MTRDQDLRRRRQTRPDRGLRLRSGFTLVELLVALGMFTIVLVGALMLLDATNRVTRTQMGRADIQQAIRVAQDEMLRSVRMAGRGGLGAQSGSRPLPTGLAVEVRNNVTDPDTKILPGTAGAPEAMPNTDVLIVRGIFDAPLYEVDHVGDPSRWMVSDVSNSGWVEIDPQTAKSGFVQDLQDLENRRTAATTIPEALILPSGHDPDFFGVAQVDWENSSYNTATGVFTLAFVFEDDPSSIDPLNPDDRIEAYSALSSEGHFPARELARSGFKSVGILSEYRYYVRRNDTASGAVTPMLSRTRTLPNWDALWDQDASAPLFEDISNAVVDLQVAMGFSDEAGPTAGAVVDNDDNTDQWFLNDAGDVALPAGDLRLLRVTSLARTEWAERGYEAPPILELEDRSYSPDGLNDVSERRHHRFFLETVIDLRNL